MDDSNAVIAEWAVEAKVQMATIKVRLENLEKHCDKCQAELREDAKEGTRNRIEWWKIAISVAALLASLALVGLAIMTFVSKFLP